MSGTQPAATGAAADTESPGQGHRQQLVLELAVGQHRYQIVLPNAETDYIQKGLATSRTPYELEMLEDIRSRVKPGALVLDIGANIGNHALYLAAVAGCRVEAFEPNPALCAAVRQSIALNALGDRLKLHETGLGRAPDRASFTTQKPSNLGSQSLALGSGEMLVSVLDTFGFDRPVEVIKLDVEGMELDVLDGAAALLQRDRPLVYVECSTEARYRSMARWMSARNYACVDTFNATPTHLFVPAEHTSVEERLTQLQAKTAQSDYKAAQLLREVRQRVTQALERERVASSALAEATAREQSAHAALAQTEQRLRDEHDAVERLQTLDRANAARVSEQGLRLEAAQREIESYRGQPEELQQLRRQHEQAAAAALQLTQIIAVREARLAAIEQREATLAERLDQTREELTGAEQRVRDEQAVAEALRALERAGTERSKQLSRRLADAKRDVEKQRGLSEQLRRLRGQHEQAEATTRRLTRMVEVREARLAATERRQAALTERLERTRNTASFRIGQALVDARRSVRGAVRLPVVLLKIYRDAMRRRRQTAPMASAPIPTPVIAPPTPKAPASAAPTTAQVGPEPQRVPPTIPSKAVPAAKALAPADAPARLPDLGSRPISSLRVAAVMDEFTHHSFVPECDLLPLRPGQWREQVDAFMPEIVFIESAWRGSEGLWSLKVSNPSEEIMGLIAWARRQGVPTLFWNKEDPVHFGGFQHLAKAVDHVFTTDIDCIARYKREIGHDRVYLLPFAAQPATHNPIETFPREAGYCFAGSYYLKYPERQRDFRALLDVVRDLGPVEIFDRNYEKPHPHYEFPPEYRPYVVGSLPFEQIDRAYKGYRFGINMNTIKQSQTMFARRVFELLASNTVVVSNFSRGVRLLFGDLVICSDAPDEIRRRLAPLDDDLFWRKFRLAGLRKVMTQHTYAHRLAYVVDKLGGGRSSAQPGASLCAVAFPRDAGEADRLLDGWRRQSLPGASLCLVGSHVPAALAGGQVEVIPDVASLAASQRYARARWIAPLSANDHHGAHYLADLLLATRFGRPSAVGKAAHYRCVPGADRPELIDAELVYRPVPALPARASLLPREAFESLRLADADGLDVALHTGGGLLAIDEFNYLRDAGPSPSDLARATVADLQQLRHGIDAAQRLFPRAERIAAAVHGDAAAGAQRAPGLSAQQLADLLPGSARGECVDGHLRLNGPGKPEQHRYVYLNRVFERAELNLELNSRYELLATRDVALDVRTVFEFLDDQQQKISHAMVRIGAAHSMAIPARCRFVRFGLRLQGSGKVLIQRLVLADLRERPSTLAATGDCLLVAKQYPAYDDLYRYGFVHSRVRAYREAGTTVDVLRLNADEPCSFREFEGTDVVQGDRDLLDLALREGGYGHVLVHLLDAAMWETLERHLDRVKLTVWVHGAEIQAWQRRAFEFDGLDPDEVTRRKALSEQRSDFWRRILRDPHPNLTLVFVSRYVADEAAADLGIDLARVRHHVIHNFIDGSLFSYRAKDPSMRHRILSIRPYASRAYGNDLMVEAIHRLADRPFFPELAFRIIGDGELFEATTASLAAYPNVSVERRFLPQAQIASLHAEYGVFLCPTRMDTQGVSRDEAMASGLVPVTNRVAAVPEFADDQCAMLAAAEDAGQLAAAIEALHLDASRFQALSAAAALRVRLDRGLQQTIARELALIVPT